MNSQGSNIPRIDLQSAPAEEHDSLWIAEGALLSMDRFVGNFLVALQLLEYCMMQDFVSGGQSKVFSQWAVVGCRDAVMSIWHFRHSMLTANNISNKSPFLGPKLNRPAMGEAHAKFDQYFPTFAAHRHAVAHAGELDKSMDHFKTNSFSGTFERPGIKLEGVKNFSLQDALINRTYTSTVDEQIVELEMAGPTFAKLVEVKNLFFSAYPQPQPPRPVQQPGQG